MPQTRQVAPYTLERIGVIMAPDPSIPEESEGVLNPAVARGRDGELYLLPRIVGPNNYSRVGLARVLFDDAGEPRDVERLGYVLEPEMEYELRPEQGDGGCEDPRVTYVEPLDLYVMAYAAHGPRGPRVALAVSEDLRSWDRLGVADFEPDVDPLYGVEFDELHNKDAAFFPTTLRAPNGEPSLVLMHRPVYSEADLPENVDDHRPSIWISYCALEPARRDPTNLTRLRMHHVLIDPEHDWDAIRLGGGTEPVLTPHGWFTIYHGATGSLSEGEGPHRKSMVYSAGALLLDRDDPLKVLYRSPQPIMAPETPEETAGIVANVIFPTGIDEREGGRYDVYYGMADERIGVAKLQLPDRSPAGAG